MLTIFQDLKIDLYPIVSMSVCTVQYTYIYRDNHGRKK